MPNKSTPQLKNPKLYEDLRDEGNSKQKAARISNAAAAQGTKKVASKGGKSGTYDDWTVAELNHRAKEIGLAHAAPALMSTTDSTAGSAQWCDTFGQP